MSSSPQSKVSNVNSVILQVLFALGDMKQEVSDLEILAALEIAAEDHSETFSFHKEDLEKLKLRVDLDRSLANERYRRAKEYEAKNLPEGVIPLNSVKVIPLNSVKVIPVEDTEAYENYKDLSERVDTFINAMNDVKFNLTKR